jgi:transposase
MGRFRHFMRRVRLAIAKVTRRGARLRAASEARKRNIVVGPSFTYHVVNRPEETGEDPTAHR